MKTLICLGLVLLGWNCPVPAQDTAAAPVRIVFQIGVADGDYREFALAGNFQAYLQNFHHDADFTVGQSDPKKDWPWIQPGPTDAWAGSRPHVFKITFDLAEVATGYYRLVLDFVDTHAGEGRSGEERRVIGEETVPSLLTRRSSQSRPSPVARRRFTTRRPSPF